MVGALMIMACVTVANMRKGVLLHKLILCEVSTLQSLRFISLIVSPAPPGHVARLVLFHGL
jgi:hypothetical protein